MSHYDDIIHQASKIVQEAASSLSTREQIKACVASFHAACGAPPFKVDGIGVHKLPSGETVYVVVQCVSTTFFDLKGEKHYMSALHHDLVMFIDGRFQVVPMEGGGH